MYTKGTLLAVNVHRRPLKLAVNGMDSEEVCLKTGLFPSIHCNDYKISLKCTLDSRCTTSAYQVVGLPLHVTSSEFKFGNGFRKNVLAKENVYPSPKANKLQITTFSVFLSSRCDVT